MANTVVQWAHIVPETTYGQLKTFLNELGFTKDVLNSRSALSQAWEGQPAIPSKYTPTPTSGDFRMGNVVELPTTLEARLNPFYPHPEAGLHNGWTELHSTYNAAMNQVLSGLKADYYAGSVTWSEAVRSLGGIIDKLSADAANGRFSFAAEGAAFGDTATAKLAVAQAVYEAGASYGVTPDFAVEGPATSRGATSEAAKATFGDSYLADSQTARAWQTYEPLPSRSALMDYAGGNMGAALEVYGGQAYKWWMSDAVQTAGLRYVGWANTASEVGGPLLAGFDIGYTGATMVLQYQAGDTLGMTQTGTEFAGRWTGISGGSALGADIGFAAGTLGGPLGEGIGTLVGGLGGGIYGAWYGEDAVKQAWNNPYVQFAYSTIDSSAYQSTFGTSSPMYLNSFLSDLKNGIYEDHPISVSNGAGGKIEFQDLPGNNIYSGINEFLGINLFTSGDTRRETYHDSTGAVYREVFYDYHGNVALDAQQNGQNWFATTYSQDGPLKSPMSLIRLAM